MNLEKIAIIPRQRSSWEAIDLGFQMARAWWCPLVVCWLLPVACLFALLTVVFYETPWLVGLLVWWLKPLWDRLPLYLASRKLFAEEPGVKKLVSAWREVTLRDLLPWLLWRRFSLTRSMDMPVTVLENLRGERRAKRLQILHYRSGNAASWLTVVCIHLELVVSFGLLALFALMLPNEVEVPWFDIFVHGTKAQQHMLNGLSCLAMALIAPFYVLAGFALYISRRVELEAWDIEIRFRQMADRFSQEKNKNGFNRGFLVLAFLTGLGLLPAPFQPVRAQVDAVENEAGVMNEVYLEEREFSARVIESILQGPTFRNQKTVTQWRWKKSEEMEEEQFPEWMITLVEWIESLTRSTKSLRTGVNSGAYILEFTLWVLFAAILLYFVIKYRASLLKLMGMRFSAGKKPVSPVELFGLDVTRDSLPEDIPPAVMLFWRAGQQREALALLFRALLARLMHDHGFAFKDGYTEQECVQVVHASGNRELADYTRELALMWQELAYAHRQPQQVQVEQCCEQWRRVFPDEK